LTAIRPATGEDAMLAPPAVNIAATLVFPDHVAAARPADVHLVLVLDGAGWHVSRDLVVSPNFALVVLPTYRPELNPVERVWVYLRTLPVAAPPRNDRRHHRCLDAPRRPTRQDQVPLQLPAA
jgi:transposase